MAGESTGGVSVPAFPEATLPLLLLKEAPPESLGYQEGESLAFRNPSLLLQDNTSGSESASTGINGLHFCKEPHRAEWPGSKGGGTFEPQICWDHLAAQQSSVTRDRLGSCLQI